MKRNAIDGSDKDELKRNKISNKGKWAGVKINVRKCIETEGNKWKWEEMRGTEWKRDPDIEEKTKLYPKNWTCF